MSSASLSMLESEVRDGINTNFSPLPGSVAVLTGGFDKPYVFGLTMALASKGIGMDVIGSDAVDCPAMHTTPNLSFLNLRGSKEEAGIVAKIDRVISYYTKLIKYAASSQSKIFHILWNNKFQYFDRTALMLYYKMLKKKIVFTAHNVNAGKRDGNDSFLNRLTLRVQYQLSDHIFVHTEKMKQELLQDFGKASEAVTVIPFGINNSVPNTALTTRNAKRQLGIGENQKTVLFFGAILPYKGLEFLVDAFQRLAEKDSQYRLVIAGLPRKGAETYVEQIQQTINRHSSRGQVIQRIEYVPDEETELYFKAADILALPYTHVFQSGVLFLANSFGLPVVAANVGSLADDIVPGKNGFLFTPKDSDDLARALEQYFKSDLFLSLEASRAQIRDAASVRHSWDTVGDMTQHVYAELLRETRQ